MTYIIHMQIRQARDELSSNGSSSILWKHEARTGLLGIGYPAAIRLSNKTLMMSVGAIERELIEQG